MDCCQQQRTRLIGRAGVSADMALRLSHVFGTGAEMWLSMPIVYKLWWPNTAASAVLGACSQPCFRVTHFFPRSSNAYFFGVHFELTLTVAHCR